MFAEIKKRMCRFQELYHNEEGYVIRCEGSQHYQLLFGGVVLSMNEEEYRKFAKAVAACRQDLLHCQNENEVVMPTMRQGVHLLLNQQKLTRLHRMLEEADTEAKTLNLLQLFQR